MKENEKLKRLLKHLYEGKEFHTSFEDEVYSWNGYQDEIIYEEYVFNYYMEVGKVLGEGDRAVASINVIITDISKDEDDYYYDWTENDYNEDFWYISVLQDKILDEMLPYFPFSIYLTFYGYDEYENLPLSEKNL